MKPVSVILVASASTLVLSAAAWRTERPLNPRESHVRAEVARLRAHFDRVDAELRVRDVSHLSAGQRASRAKLIAWLKEYRDAGQFPQNDRFANEMVPFFRDSHGTLCAMAYLVDRAGRADIVDHIARTRNNAFIPELADDRELVAWLDASGLSVSEAARIQPSYDGGGCCTIEGPAASDVKIGRSKTYSTISFGLDAASLGTLGFNLFAPSRASGLAGLVTGVSTIVAGASYLGDTPNAKAAKINAVIGSAAVLGGARALLAKRDTGENAPPQASPHGLLSEVTIAPDLIASSRGTRFGLRMQGRF